MSYNEQERILDLEKEFGKYVTPFLIDLGAADLYMFERQGNNPALPHYYRLRNSHNHRKRTEVCFKAISYSESNRKYEESQVFEESSEDTGEREHIVAPPEGLQRKIIREVKSREESSTNYNGSVSFSITHTDKVSAKAKGGIDGIVEAEASAESTTQTSLKTDFGWANGQKASTEKTVRGETTINIPGNETRTITTTVSKIKEVRPFHDIAYVDFELDMDLYDWSGNYSSFAAWRGSHNNVIHCANIQDLLWLIEGQRSVEYPGMKDFLSKCSDGSKKFYEWLKNKENRKVEILGQRVRYYPSSFRYTSKSRVINMGFFRQHSEAIIALFIFCIAFIGQGIRVESKLEASVNQILMLEQKLEEATIKTTDKLDSNNTRISYLEGRIKCLTSIKK